MTFRIHNISNKKTTSKFEVVFLDNYANAIIDSRPFVSVAIAAAKTVSVLKIIIAATIAIAAKTPIAGFSLTKSTMSFTASSNSSSNLSLSILNSIDKVSEREKVSYSGTLNEFSSSIFKLAPLVDTLIDNSISFAFAKIDDNSMLSLFRDALRLSSGVCISVPSNSPPLNFMTEESPLSIKFK